MKHQIRNDFPGAATVPFRQELFDLLAKHKATIVPSDDGLEIVIASVGMRVNLELPIGWEGQNEDAGCPLRAADAAGDE